jgi:hypothetical protein
MEQSAECRRQGPSAGRLYDAPAKPAVQTGLLVGGNGASVGRDRILEAWPFPRLATLVSGIAKPTSDGSSDG